MQDNELDDFLAHHGVKGMKWGVRKDKGSPKAPSERKVAKDKKKQAYKANLKSADAKTRRGQAYKHTVAESKAITKRGLRRAAVIGGVYTAVHLAPVAKQVFQVALQKKVLENNKARDAAWHAQSKKDTASLLKQIGNYKTVNLVPDSSGAFVYRPNLTPQRGDYRAR